MKAKLIKWAKVIGILIITFVIAYNAVIERLWSLIEPSTYYQSKSSRFVFYGIAFIIALIVAVIYYRRANRKQFLEEFNNKTQQIINKAKLTISGTGSTFEKKEILTIEEQLQLGKPVLVTGDAGTGKSGIGVSLARNAEKRRKAILIIDARQVQDLQDENSLRDFYRCKEPIEKAISELGTGKGFRLVIDQLDNIADKLIADILIDLAIECSKAQGVQVIVISRKRESHETKLLNPLLQNSFAEIECRELDEIEVQKELQYLGIENPPTEVVAMCKNLLNLDILSNIKIKNPAFAFNEIEDEVTLWNSYFDTLQDRESIPSNLDNAERTLSEAMKLAKNVLASDGQEFILEKPLSSAQRRLLSWEIIVHEEGARYRFKHEKLQDYLYATCAADRGYMPQDVINEIGTIKSRNAFVWLAKIYLHRKSAHHIQFLEVLLLNE